MREMIGKRLADLRDEYNQGEKILAELDARREKTVHAMLRISGAMQVLEEMLAEEANNKIEAIQTNAIEREAIEQPLRIESFFRLSAPSSRQARSSPISALFFSVF